MSDFPQRLPSLRSLLVLLAVVLALVASGYARADAPVLGEHRFVPSTIVSWPFVLTEVASTSAAGSTGFVFEPDPSVGLPLAINLDGRFISASQTLSGAVAFGGIFALDAQITAGGILPRDTASSLVVGAHGVSGGSVGAAVRLFRGGPFQLTLRADFDDLATENIIPLRLPRSPRVSGSILGARPALAAALAVLPRLGLQGSVTVDWRRYDVGARDDVTSLAGALAATISLDPVPLTVLAAADVNHDFGRDLFTPTADAVFGPERTEWNVEGGLYITTVRELDVGLLFRAQLSGGADDRSWQGEFRLGYYF